MGKPPWSLQALVLWLGGSDGEWRRGVYLDTWTDGSSVEDQPLLARRERRLGASPVRSLMA